MPRSPSRDLSDRFDGNRAYFRRPDRIRRDKYLLAVVALVLAGWWAVADVAVPSRANYSHTHGPLANPHAAWDQNCAACHREHSWSEFGPRSVFAARDRWHDFTCGKCHTGAAHNANLTAAGNSFHTRCSNCHHDHSGRENSLTRISDNHCTRCHADLAPQHATGTPKCAGKITDFVSDHPEFRPLASPPIRTLKFSHALHMTPGQAHTPGGKEAMTVAKLRTLSGNAAERYRKPGQGDGDTVQLDCASCHQLDSGAGSVEYEKLRDVLAAAGEPGHAVLPARAAGAHFLPVNFEAACRACHPLRAPEGASGNAVIPGFAVPHRRQPTELRAEMAAGYLRELLKTNHPALAAPAEPGGRLDPRPAPAARTLRKDVDDLTNTAAELLLSPTTNLRDHATEGCAKCHDIAEGKIAAVPDRTVWFRAARFDHAKHRATSCATCHPNATAAFAPAGTALVEKEPAQLPGIDSCRACHSPAGTRVTLSDGTAAKGGGIRHGCTDCHSYHNADHGLQGRGAKAGFPERPLGLAEFLRGK